MDGEKDRCAPHAEEGNQLVIYIEMPVGPLPSRKNRTRCFFWLIDTLFLFFIFIPSSYTLFFFQFHHTASLYPCWAKKKKRNTSFIKILLFIHYICIYKNKQPMRNVSHRIQFYCVEGNQTAAARRTAVFIFLLTGTCWELRGSLSLLSCLN